MYIVISVYFLDSYVDDIGKPLHQVCDLKITANLNASAKRHLTKRFLYSTLDVDQSALMWTGGYDFVFLIAPEPGV